MELTAGGVGFKVCAAATRLGLPCGTAGKKSRNEFQNAQYLPVPGHVAPGNGDFASFSVPGAEAAEATSANPADAGRG